MRCISLLRARINEAHKVYVNVFLRLLFNCFLGTGPLSGFQKCEAWGHAPLRTATDLLEGTRPHMQKDFTPKALAISAISTSTKFLLPCTGYHLH